MKVELTRVEVARILRALPDPALSKFPSPGVGYETVALINKLKAVHQAMLVADGAQYIS